jgi:IclR family pca regulon transcriptional regulator
MNETVFRIDGGQLIRSLARGLDVILGFSQNRPRMTLSHVAKATGLSRPTARRILLTLEPHGYANLTEVAQPHMERVVERTQEGCSLATLDQTEVVYVTRVPTHRISGITLATGTRLPAHATSMGHVLLAGLTEPELQRYLAQAELSPLTGHTITRRDDLISRLDLVRQQAHAIVDQELEQGLRSVAAPVRDSNGRVIAALALSAITATTDEHTFRNHHATIIVDAAQQISRELGADFSSQNGG